MKLRHSPKLLSVGISLVALLTLLAAAPAALAIPPYTPEGLVMHTRESPIFLSPHEARVSSLAFSPDGRTLMSGSHDGYLRRWDADNGRFLSMMLGDDAIRGIEGLAISPDGKFVAIVGALLDKDVKIWEVGSARIVAGFEGQGTYQRAVAYSADGRTLATAGDEVALRDMPSGKILATLKHSSKGIKAIAFSADGKLIATAGNDRQIRIWSVPDGKLEATLKGPLFAIEGLAISPDGKIVAAVTAGLTRPGKTNDELIAGGQLWQWDRASGKGHKTDLGKRSGKAIVFLSPTKVAVAAGSDALLCDLQTDAGAQPEKLWSLSEDVLALAISPDGQKLAAGGLDRTVDVVDLAGKKLAYRLPGLTDIVTSVATSNDGKRFVTATGDVRFSNRVRAPERSFADRYKRFFSGEANANRLQQGEVLIWSSEDGRLQSKLPIEPCQVTAVLCLPKSDRLAVSGWSPAKGGFLTLWNLATLKPENELDAASSEVLSIGASADGQTLASGSADGNVILWNVASGAKQHTIAHDKPVSAVAMSADGRFVALGDLFQTVKLYEVASGTLKQTLKSHSAVKDLDFSPDMTYLAAGTEDPGMDLWNLKGTGSSRTLVVEGDHFGQMPGYVTFSPDGRYVVCGGHGKNIAVFDVAKAALHTELMGHFHAPTAAAFLPDGRLVSGGEERTVRLWDVNAKEKLLATWVVMPADESQNWRNEWVAYTPSGQFVASQAIDRLAGWQTGGAVIASKESENQKRVENLFTAIPTASAK